MRRRGLILTSLFLLAAAGSATAKEGRLLRFPDIHQDRIVFSHGGDLWLVSSNGGTATRLTTHEGLEIFPRFSRDGSMVAFTGQYDGDQNVFVMPTANEESITASTLTNT